MRRPRGAFTAAATTLAVSATLLACGGGSSSSSQSPGPTGAAASDPVLLHGRALYEAHCAQCHGVAGAGGFGPSLTGGKLLRDFSTVAAEISFVHGRRIGGDLTATQLRDAVRYEREVLSPSR